MNRKEEYQKLTTTKHWDLIIIGGGATGLGIALDGALRGYKTLLCEAKDFAQGTSSRSTKLLHGGVRYLAQCDFSLVYEALRERDRLIQNAPHLCKEQTFIIPNENLFQACFYTFGLKIYDYMAGALGIGKTSYLKGSVARDRLKGIRQDKIQSGVCYYDGQFDDARLALALAQSAVSEGACVMNYARIESLLKDNEKLKGVRICLEDTKEHIEVYGKCVVNATGVFTDTIHTMDDEDSQTITPSQGIHLVFNQSFMPSKDALMIPKTSDRRVLFAIPWQNKLVVGTTDTPISKPSYEPRALEEEIAFILKTFGEYVETKPRREDILSVFVGLRPLVANHNAKATKSISRSHKIYLSPSGLVNINGGKWTTYRQMAEDCFDVIFQHKILPKTPCETKDYKIYGYMQKVDREDRLCMYGTKASEIYALEQDSVLGQPIHKDYAFTYAQVLWALEQEMALDLSDILARRLRLLFLDAHAARESAENVGKFMAKHLGWSDEILTQQVNAFMELSKQYILS